MSDLSSMSLMGMFREELANQSYALERDLLALEQQPESKDLVDALMRASHSIKGAARVVNVDPLVKLAHAMEDAFTQQRTTELEPMFAAVDLFRQCAVMTDEALEQWATTQDDTPPLLEQIFALEERGDATPAKPASHQQSSPTATQPDSLRVTADNLTRLLELGGQVMVDAAQMERWSDASRRLRLQLEDAVDLLDEWRSGFAADRTPDNPEAMSRLLGDYRTQLRDSLSDYERLSRRLTRVSSRLYNELGAIRMRPFSDGVSGMQRMVRDLSRQLGKKVELRVLGERTKVDRDILARLDAPLTHLVRNAVDHGLENPAERLTAGKPEMGTLVLEAKHRAGKLHITVRDDGRGFDIERLRTKVVERGFNEPATAAGLSDDELLAFLFLPGFSTASHVTEISGRGVGLDVVQTMVQEVGGQLRVVNDNGAVFHLELPLTLSVVRMLLFESGGETWAVPLSRIASIVPVTEQELPTLDDFAAATADVAELLGFEADSQYPGAWLMTQQGESPLALRVERLLGERELVVRPLDARFEAFPPMSAWTSLEDGRTAFILDWETLCNMAAHGGEDVERESFDALVADDSPTVRRMLRQILEEAGYSVREADDGQTAWTLLQMAQCRLLVTDLDMPRMDGVELVKKVKSDPRLRETPVIMISYREGAEDRMEAITAGVAYYLDKGSFAKEMFLLAVSDLIGETP